MTTAATRILVLKLAFGEQHATRLEQFNDRLVGREDLLAVIFGQAMAEDAGLIHVASLVQLVLDAGIEIVCSVRRRGVDSAGTLVGGDVLRQHPQDLAVQERMDEGGVLHFRAGEPRNLPSSASI